MQDGAQAMEMVLITGMSGSGKSVALHALEDAGFYCVDNLPPELLLPFVELEQQHQARRIAIAMDVRSATSLPLVPHHLDTLRSRGIHIKSLFLDSDTETLVRRYSETRRKHPLSQPDPGNRAQDARRALVEAIELERTLLATLREQAHVIDSSIIRAAQLQGYVKALISAPTGQLTLVFESFAFKRGVPTDADYVFDVRMLPNPHYESDLRALTGRSAADVEPHRPFFGKLVGRPGPRPPQLCDGGHWLHWWAAPLSLFGRAIEPALHATVGHTDTPPGTRRALKPGRAIRPQRPAAKACEWERASLHPARRPR